MRSPAAGAPLLVPIRTPTPPPTASSIETLLDGITGPRPPMPKITAESKGADAAAFQGVHAVGAAHLTPPDEPAVVAPPPEPMRRSGEPTIRAMRPRNLDSTTVFTSRKAAVRNTFALLLSAALVAMLLVFAVRWSDGRKGRSHGEVATERVGEPTADPSLAVAPPSAPSSPPSPPSRAPAVPPPPPEASAAPPRVEAALAAVPAPLAAPKVHAPVRKAAHGAAPEPVKGSVAGPTPSATATPPENLDDLNRQIRH